jgi:alpha-beta hydrolase superfamily lysophospholipase
MSRPRNFIRLGAATLAIAALIGGTAGTAGGESVGPEYPSAEWFDREARNYAMTQQAPTEQASDPAFEQRWLEQSRDNFLSYFQARYVDMTWPWDSTGNLCNHWSGPCTGDPFRYPGVDPFYENEGRVEEVIYFDSGGALLSGRVWAPKWAEPGDDLPGVVIETGSVQAPEPLYWWFAQTLVRNGYVVMTYDVRGQGRSDNRDANGQPGSNFDSDVFATDLVDSIELFLSTPQAPFPHGSTRDDVELTSHNPFFELLDHDRLGIVGHSLGASGVSVVQGMDPWPGRLLESNPVDAAIAWDNLSATASLAGYDATPRVPTMGQSGDYYLTPTPYTSPPDTQGKNAGFNAWKEADVPTYQVNIRGGTHYEWSLLPGFPTTSWDGWGNPMADHYSLAWLDRWLKAPGELGYETADARLLSDAAWSDRMSFYFLSARDYPSRDGVAQECADIKTGCAIAEPEQVATSLSLEIVGKGANRTLNAALTDAESGAGIAGETVTFFADGNEIGTAVTDASGRATLVVPKTYRTGHHSFDAEYAGDEQHAPSSAQATS